MTTRKLDSRRQRARRFVRAQSPLQSPPFKPFHAVLGLLVLAVYLLPLRAPGLAADLSGIQIGGENSWELFVLLRVTIMALAWYAVVLVRAMHWSAAVSLTLWMVGLSLRLGDNRITHVPLTLGFLLLLLGILGVVVRLIARPNDADRAAQLEQAVREGASALETVQAVNADLLEENAGLRAENERLREKYG